MIDILTLSPVMIHSEIRNWMPLTVGIRYSVFAIWYLVRNAHYTRFLTILLINIYRKHITQQYPLSIHTTNVRHIQSFLYSFLTFFFHILFLLHFYQDRIDNILLNLIINIRIIQIKFFFNRYFNKFQISSLVKCYL